MNLDVLQIAASIAPADLAALQAHAAEIAEEEIREASARFAGPELLYRLEHTAILHLIVCGILNRHVEKIEAAAEPVLVRSGRWTRRVAALKRRYDRLRTLGYATRRRTDRRSILRVRCRCVCGEIVVVRSSDLRAGLTRSCGCLRDETTRARHRALAIVRLRLCAVDSGAAEMRRAA